MKRVSILFSLMAISAGLCGRTLEDFNDDLRIGWSDLTFELGAVTEGAGVLTFDLLAGRARQPIFVASARASERMTLAEGQTAELAIDLVSATSDDPFAVLAWVPDTQPVAVFTGYFIAKSGNEVRVGKAIHKYFWAEQPQPTIKNQNVRLVLSLGATNGTVTLRGRVLDNDAAGAVLFDRTFVDTPGADSLASGTDNPAAPFTGDGQFVLMGYTEFQPGDPDLQQVSFDNAEVSTAAPTNYLPVIHDVVPTNTASFLPTDPRFQLFGTDDKPWDFASGIAAFAEGPFGPQGIGVVSGTDGKTLRANPTSSAAPNQDYTARLLALDSEGGSNVVFLHFDTFCPANPVIEVEDYNFGGGQFIDQPVQVPEGSGPTNTAYLGQVGAAETDFHDTGTNASNGHYRPQDSVGTKRSLDYLRAKFSEAGGPDANVFDYDVHEIAAGEFLTYTRTLPENDYAVFLREAVLNLDRAEAVLERVMQQPGGGQTVTELGRFVGQRSGFEYRNVPLTDTNGTPVRVRLGGTETLRLRQLTSAPADGGIFQNYLVFAPPVDRCLTVESAPAPDGPYAPDGGVAVQGSTVTVKPLSQQARFFRVRIEQTRDRLRVRDLRRVAGGLAFDVELF